VWNTAKFFVEASKEKSNSNTETSPFCVVSVGLVGWWDSYWINGI